MKYIALIVGLFVADRVLLWLFPSSDAVCTYATVGAALVAIFAFIAGEVKSSRTAVE